MSKKLLILAVLALFVLSCGLSFDMGGTPVPQQQVAPQVQVIPQQPAQQPQVLQPQVIPATQAPIPVVPTLAPVQQITEPPTITGKEALDCFPYPNFNFLYDDGIEAGVSLPVLAKAEAKWAEKGVDWYEVDWNGFKCWVYGGFVTKSGDFSQLKVHAVVVPWPPQPPYCDNQAKLAKIHIGLRVWLPWSQESIRGTTGWFDGMSEYSGHSAIITAFGGIDRSGCMTVFVDYDGSQYPWRVRNLYLSKP